MKAGIEGGMEQGMKEGRERHTQHPFNTTIIFSYSRVVLLPRNFLIGAMSDVNIIPLLLFTNLGLSGLSCGGVQHRNTNTSAPSGCTAFVRFKRTTLYFMSFLCFGSMEK